MAEPLLRPGDVLASMQARRECPTRRSSQDTRGDGVKLRRMPAIFRFNTPIIPTLVGCAIAGIAWRRWRRLIDRGR
jgi:hypothetical protein